MFEGWVSNKDLKSPNRLLHFLLFPHPSKGGATCILCSSSDLCYVICFSKPWYSNILLFLNQTMYLDVLIVVACPSLTHIVRLVIVWRNPPLGDRLCLARAPHYQPIRDRDRWSMLSRDTARRPNNTAPVIFFRRSRTYLTWFVAH